MVILKIDIFIHKFYISPTIYSYNFPLLKNKHFKMKNTLKSIKKIDAEISFIT